MEISDVDATIHRTPIELPLLDSPAEWEIVFVAVETTDGTTGYGFTAISQVFGIHDFLTRESAPLLSGENALETGRLWHLLQQELNSRMQTGVWSSAVSAVDIALWDVKGNTTANRCGDSWAGRAIQCPRTSRSA